MKNRVVVTGLGCVSTYGIGVEKLWDNLISNKASIEQVPKNWSISDKKSYLSPLERLDYKALGFVKNELLQYEQVTLNALISLEEAIKNAQIPYIKQNDKMNKLSIGSIDNKKIGVFAGTGIGGIETFSNVSSHLRGLQQGEKSGRLDALCVAKTMPYNIAAAIGIKLDLHHNIESHTNACATGTVLVGKAFKAIKNGDIECAIVCASECADHEAGVLFNAFSAAGTLAKHNDDISRINIPFDKDRSGFLFSCGASGTLILESLESAKKRGAPILAEIINASETFDGFNMVAPNPDGQNIKEMINTLLDDVGVSYNDIDYINAHGTGTLKNDEIESKVIADLFADTKVSVSSTKSFIGHSIAASGLIEAIVTTLSIKNQFIHGNNGLKNSISEQFELPKKAKEKTIDYAISQSFAFGGHNASVLFKDFKED